jgi:flap endonuclease-1
MGIKNLNRFIRDHCTVESIKCVPVSHLSGKKIAVDISIYIYKFVGDDCLIENMYLMLSIFKHYNVIPIFVFDGKPPTEKKELLIKRKNDKKYAENEYNKLKENLKSDEIDDDEKQEIITTMDLLKKQFVYIQKDQINMIKEMISSYGMTYYEANGEADEFCALLVLKKIVWACLSEDMDMFVYGCSKVLRYFSLLNHTLVLYDTKKIVEELGLTQKDFREICVLSGTDYNIQSTLDTESMNLYKVLKLYKKYHKTDKKYTFYDWLRESGNSHLDYELLMNVYSIFDLHYDDEYYNNLDNLKIVNSYVDKEKLQSILKKDGFIFPK